MLGLLLWLTLARAEVPSLEAPTDQLSPKEKIEAANAAIEEMRQDIGLVQRMMEQAKSGPSAADVQRCLQSSLLPMQTLLDVSGQSERDMKSALADSDTGHADLEYRKILVAVQKVREFLAKAMLCIGNPVGNTSTLTESNITYAPDDSSDTSNEVDQGMLPDLATPI